MADEAMRASDSEREEVADRLRAAAAEGRLDPDELDERVGEVYAARTRGELVAVTHDLPAPVVARAPVSRYYPVRRRLPGFIIPNAICNVVWLATGADYYWWPGWVLFGTGIGMLVAIVHAVFGTEEPRSATAPARRAP